MHRLVVLAFAIALTAAPLLRPARADAPTGTQQPSAVPTTQRSARPAPLTGRVLGDDGEPVGRASVMLVPAAGGQTGPRPVLSGSSDKEGKFVLRDAVGDYLLLARENGQKAATTRPARVTAGQDVTVRVSRGAWLALKGRVTDPAGLPLPGVRVAAQTLLPGTEAHWIDSIAKTDAEGRYSLTPVYPGLSYTILVEPMAGYEDGKSDTFSGFKPGEARDVPDIKLKKRGR